MYATSLNPTKINTPACIYTSPSFETTEQSDLRTILEEERSQHQAVRLCSQCPDLYAAPEVDPDEFETCYLWFIS